MKWFQSLPIRLLILALLLFMALPAVGLIIHAGFQDRDKDLKDATRASTYLLNNIASELQNKVEASRQMLEMLSMLPEVRQQNREAVNALLADLLRNYPIYANILIVDRSGMTWAGNTPGNKPINLADRKAFRDAMSTGRFSAGEYNVGRSSQKPILNFAFPLKDQQGNAAGAILCGISLEYIGSLFKVNTMPAGTSFGVFDHNGVFLYRTVDPGRFIGKQDRQSNFQKMKNGPDEGVIDLISNDGIKRHSAYRKIRLTEDQPPYAYIRGGIPTEVVLKQANTTMIQNISLFTMVLILVFALSLLVSRRLIVNRILALQEASRSLASGDLQVRVADQIKGGELGKLGEAFNEMASALARELAEREKSQSELLRLQKLESLGLLAGGIAHDFNNILTGIMGNISIARLSLHEPDKAEELLARAEKASKRAAELAYQLLTFAKGGKPIRKVVNARHLLEETATLVLHGSNVLSSIKVPADLHAIYVDEGQIHQVFHNIIINAVQSMPDGGTIAISAENVTIAGGNATSFPAGKYVRFTLSDTGCGISAENQKRIFDPYFTTKAGGKGLGLASAHSIIINHGGQISARSAKGLGTTFDILLPASDDPALEPEAPALMPPFSHQPECSILVMDDEEMIRDLLAEMLAGLGYRVTTCANGAEALNLYTVARQERNPFAAVIMDLTIPGGMGGKEAAQKILANDPTARLVVSSGYSNDPIMADYPAYGFSATMLKPYKMAEVAEVMNRILVE